MNFSNRIKTLAKAPKYINKNKINLDHSAHLFLKKLDVKIDVYFTTTQKDELYLEMANYHTDLQGDYLGVIDGFFALIQNKPLEACDRFPIKELDFYLRDKPDTASFTAYSQELYEILSIGEKIKEHVMGDSNKSFQFNGDFFDLSTSEQYDLIEEFFAYFIYPSDEFPNEIEVDQITDNDVILNPDNKKIKELLKQKLNLV